MTRMSIRLKQILGVTALVGAVVVALSVVNLARIARLSLEESRARGELLTNAVFHRAREVVTSRETAYAELAADAGVRSILRGLDLLRRRHLRRDRRRRQVAIAHSDPAQVGKRLAPAGSLHELLARNGLSAAGRDLVNARPHARVAGAAAARRPGVRRHPHRHLDAARAAIARRDAVTPALATATGALLVSVLVAIFLAQAVLRPIHVIQSSLTRLGRGELGVTLDLEEAEVQDLRGVFDAVSAQLRRLPAGGAGAARDRPALQARVGAGPADGRRRARGEEPAQRDDDPSGAAAPEARERRAGRRRARRTPTSSATRSSGSTPWCRAS